MKSIQDEFTGKYTRDKRYRLRYPDRETERSRHYIQSHREERRRRRLQLRYGITLEEFDALLGMQGHCCAICGNGFKNQQDCCVDHDHVTDKVRGILCNRCNLSIGQFDDNPTLFENAIKYLRGQFGPIMRISEATTP